MEKTNVDEGEIRHESLDFFDDLRLRGSVERLELHIKDGLLLWLFL